MYLHFNLNPEKEADNIILFLHLRKTGGTTLDTIISKAYSDYIQRSCNWNELTFEEQKRLVMVRGHMLFGLHTKLPQKYYSYITIIRNPVERVISLYYYIRSKRNPDTETREWFNKISLDEFVIDEKVLYEFNYQTYVLVGEQSVPDKDQIKVLEEAKNNLTKYFSVVGVTNRYDETLKALQKKFSWKINYYSKINVTPNKPSLDKIPEDIIEKIKSKTTLDTELYLFANQLLDEQLGLNHNAN